MTGNLQSRVAWYSAGNIFIRSASFLLLPLYSNLISPSDFGVYSVIMSFYAVLSVFFQGGLHAALSKFYIEKEEKTEIFSLIINFIIVWGAVLLAIVLLISPSVSLLFFEKNYTALFRLITISLYIETITFYILHLFKTKEEASRAVIYSAAGAVINILLNVYFVYMNRAGIEGIIKAQLYSSLVTLVILVPYFKANYKFSNGQFIKPSFLRPLVLFSLPVLLSGLFSSLVDVADRFLINNYLGETQTGVYSFAYRIALVMNIFVISFRTAFTPYSIKLFSAGGYSDKLGKILLNLAAAGGLIILAVSFFTADLFDLRLFGFAFFTGGYQGAIYLLPLILTGYFFSALMSFYSLYPFVSGKSFHLLVSDGLALIINLALNLLLIPAAGIAGAAIATFFAFMAGAVYLFVISSGSIKISYQRRPLLTVVISSAVILAAGLYLDNILADVALIALYLFIVFSAGGINLSALRLKNG